jgi:SulP family sulfate permease
MPTQMEGEDDAGLLATFLLVVFRDLTEGILVGFGIGTLLFLHRMAQAVEIEGPWPIVEPDVPDTANGNGRQPYDAALATDPRIVVHRISGAFFFEAAGSVAAALDRIGERPKAHVIDFSAVPMVDSTAAATIAGFARKARRQGAVVYVAGARPAIRRLLLSYGVRPRPRCASGPASRRQSPRRGGARTTRRQRNPPPSTDAAKSLPPVKNSPVGRGSRTHRRALRRQRERAVGS